jgi:DNA-binding SARP family transcriptional activator
MSARRVVAFVAVTGRPVGRTLLAGALWPDTSEDHARADLRSALWRVRRSGHSLIEAADGELWLSPDVEVDLHTAVALFDRLIDGGTTAFEDVDPTVSALSCDLLPDWYEEWVLVERERVHLLRLQALEALSRRLQSCGRYARAVQAGLAAVAGEPLRESAHRAVIEAHLGQGNPVEALRQFHRLRQLLREELGVEPSPQTCQLVEAVGATARR